MPIETRPEIAVLTSVPLVLLDDGLASLQSEGRVAFGSDDFMLFERLDLARQGQPVEVLIHASRAGEPPHATWRGRYVQHVRSILGAHPEGNRFRPPMTHGVPDETRWAVYWEVDQLERLTSPIFTGTLVGLGRSKAYPRNFYPEGPILIERP